MVLLTNCRVWRAGSLSPNAWIECDPTTGKIVRIGSGDDPLPQTATLVHDLGGSAVLPGLQDSHIHVYGLGEASTYVDLSACRSIVELREELRAASVRRDTEWLIGVNWMQQSMENVYPSRADLDHAAPGRAVWLWRSCYHIGCASSEGLRRAGLDTAAAVDVSGGVIDRDEAGIPTGITVRATLDHIW